MRYLNKTPLNKCHISVEIYDLAALRLPNKREQKMKRPDIELTSVMCGTMLYFSRCTVRPRYRAILI